jgi:hypothetical protein
MKIKYVKRNNKKYEVMDFTDLGVCVKAPFQFADGTVRIIELWWNYEYLDPPYNKAFNLTKAEGRV